MECLYQVFINSLWGLTDIRAANDARSGLPALLRVARPHRAAARPRTPALSATSAKEVR